ncbi:MAG: DUF6665 family protein [Roseibium sp.]
MSLRSPQLDKNSDTDPLTAALQQEILSEKAATLTRLNKKLEASLQRLEELETASGAAEEIYQQRLADAGEALWNVTIQRELCGLNQHNAFYDHMGVSRAVRLKMGPVQSFAKQNLGK